MGKVESKRDKGSKGRVRVIQIHEQRRKQYRQYTAQVLFLPATNLDVIFSKCSYDPGLLKISNVLIPAAIAKGLPREREIGEIK